MLMQVLYGLFHQYQEQQDDRKAAAFTRNFLNHLYPDADRAISDCSTSAGPILASPSPQLRSPNLSSASFDDYRRTVVGSSLTPNEYFTPAPMLRAASDSLHGSAIAIAKPHMNTEAATRKALVSESPKTAVNATSEPRSIPVNSLISSGDSHTRIDVPTAASLLPMTPWALRDDSGSDFLILISSRDSQGMLPLARDSAAIPRMNMHADVLTSCVSFN